MSERIEAALRERRELFSRVLEAEPGRVADLVGALARRFALGGRLLCVAAGPATRSDARRVALACVEAGLPAVALVGAGVELAEQTWDLATPADAVIAFGAGLEAEDSLASAARRGACTVAFAPLRGDVTVTFPSVAPPVRQELAVALLLGAVAELPTAVAAGAGEAAAPEATPAHYLYAARGPLDVVRDRVGPAVAAAADAREAAARDGAAALTAAARALAERCAGGGQVLVAGEGGAAALAMDVAGDLRTPPDGVAWRIRRALDLTEDPVLLTALDDAARFSRQVELLGRPADALLVLAEGDASPALGAAVAVAAERGLETICMCGGVAPPAARHAIATPGPHVRETQLALWHVLRALID